MNEMSRLKSTLKEQNQRLITVSQEKVRLEAKNKMNPSIETAEIQEQTQSAISNKKLTFKSLQDKIDDLNSQVRLYLIIINLHFIFEFFFRLNSKNKMLKIITVLLIN